MLLYQTDLPVLDNCREHDQRPEPDIDHIDQDGLFVLNKFSRQRHDDPVEVESKGVRNICQSVLISTSTVRQR